MRKIIAAFNITLDGFCDHTLIIPDDALHLHYNELLSHAGGILYGRKSYQLMEDSWPEVVKNPTGNQPEDDFAVLIQDISKIVFSTTLQKVEWENARLAKESLKEEVLKLRQQPGKPILAGSRSIIIQLLNLGLVDELQLVVQPIIAGKGLPFFDDIEHKIGLSLIKTEIMDSSGSVILYYEPVKEG